MKLNVPRAARILVDAEAMGDTKAAEKWQVDDRTIRNYRARLRTDPKLSAAFREKALEAERRWHLIRARFLTDVTEHLRELCLKANPDQISDVREAVKDIGELDLAREALGVSTSHPQQSPQATEAEDRSGDEGTTAAPTADAGDDAD